MNIQWNEARRIIERMTNSDLDLLLNKAQDYSTDNIHAAGEVGIATRLVDKVHRLKNLLDGNGEPAVDESIEDTLTDIRNYSVILSLKRDGKWPRMIKSVYLAGPIDDVLHGTIKLEFPTAMTVEYGITVYSPKSAYHGAKSAPDVVARINRAAIEACDAMLVYWPNRDPSLGTGRDVEYARLHDKRVFIVAPWCTSTELHDCIVCRTVEEAFKLMAP